MRTRRKQKKAELTALLDARVVTFLLSLISSSLGGAYWGAIRNQDSSSRFTNELTVNGCWAWLLPKRSDEDEYFTWMSGHLYFVCFLSHDLIANLQLP
jgi:hypothetical protein